MEFATHRDEIGGARVAIALADGDAGTCGVARVVARELRARGMRADVAERLAVPPTDVSALVLGTSGAPGGLAALGELVAGARVELASHATALFLVRHGHARDPMVDLHALLEELHWRPDLAPVLEADEPHRGHLLRWVVHKLRPHPAWSVATETDAARLAHAIAVGLHRADELHLLRVPHGSRP